MKPSGTYRICNDVHGDSALEADLVRAHEGLVGYTAKRWFRSWRWHNMEYEDILQEGRIGLLLAIRRYDASRGKFSTYAVHYIRGYISRALRGGGMIRVPCYLQDVAGALERRLKGWRRRLRTDPEMLKAMAAEMGMRVSTLSALAMIPEYIIGSTTHDVSLYSRVLKIHGHVPQGDDDLDATLEDVLRESTLRPKDLEYLKRRLAGETLASIALGLGVTYQCLGTRWIVIMQRLERAAHRLARRRYIAIKPNLTTSASVAATPILPCGSSQTNPKDNHICETSDIGR